MIVDPGKVETLQMAIIPASQQPRAQPCDEREWSAAGERC
jgi:hypothetical protein